MSLRDLLNKQKAEKERANGTSQSVLQSGPKETAVEEKKTVGVEGGENSQALSEKGNGTEGGIQAQSSKGKDGGNSVVEQGPPDGLKGLALIRWKREHGNEKQVSKSNEVNGKNAQTLGNKTTETRINSGDRLGASENEKVREEKSASQSADAEKTNDGVIGLEELRHNLAYLANNIEQKELVAQVVRTIAMQLANSPELTPYMTNADVNLMVRGLRRAYTIAARKKAEVKEAKAAKNKGNAELEQMFRDAGLGDLNLGLK